MICRTQMPPKSSALFWWYPLKCLMNVFRPVFWMEPITCILKSLLFYPSAMKTKTLKMIKASSADPASGSQHTPYGKVAGQHSLTVLLPRPSSDAVHVMLPTNYCVGLVTTLSHPPLPPNIDGNYYGRLRFAMLRLGNIGGGGEGGCFLQETLLYLPCR